MRVGVTVEIRYSQPVVSMPIDSELFLITTNASWGLMLQASSMRAALCKGM